MLQSFPTNRILEFPNFAEFLIYEQKNARPPDCFKLKIEFAKIYYPVSFSRIKKSQVFEVNFQKKIVSTIFISDTFERKNWGTKIFEFNFLALPP